MKPGDRGEMHAFVRAVELGGFSAAARTLGLTPSALSKLVSRLEQRLGVRLLNRTTRKLATTTEGALFYERCRRILADIADAESDLGRQDRAKLSRRRADGRARGVVASGGGADREAGDGAVRPARSHPAAAQTATGCRDRHAGTFTRAPWSFA